MGNYVKEALKKTIEFWKVFELMEFGLGAIRPAFSTGVKKTLKKIVEFWKVFELRGFQLTAIRPALSN